AQTSASSSVLNRVLNDPTAIYGTLSSNGRVWLVNPAGILVGAGGRVDVAGFVASTLAIRNEDFLAGRHLFIGDGAAKDVINQGEIRTPAGGSVYLIGSKVSNEGIITTPKGETILAAGATVSLIDSATPGVKVDITGAAGNATNLGDITAEAGRIGIAGVIVRNSGTLNASSVVSEGGRIFLKASRDVTVDGAGRIVASGTSGGEISVEAGDIASIRGRLEAEGSRGSGGAIDIFGDKVGLFGNAYVDASGALGGGSLRIGGDYQGANAGVRNASFTYLGQDATLKASATGVGKGGKVIVWSDDTTRAYGSISAQGGVAGGDGGLVEVSGKQNLDFLAQVRVGARGPGAPGTLLLDPETLWIADFGGFLPQIAEPTSAFAAITTGIATISPASLAAVGGNISLAATKELIIDDPISLTAAGASLTATAGKLLVLTPGSGISTNNGAVSLTGGTAGAPTSQDTTYFPLAGPGTCTSGTCYANGSLLIMAPVNSGGGAINLVAQNGNLYLKDAVTSGGGAISLQAASSIYSGYYYAQPISGASYYHTGSMDSGAGSLNLSGSSLSLEGSIAASGGITMTATSSINNQANTAFGAGTLSMTAPSGVSASYLTGTGPVSASSGSSSIYLNSDSGGLRVVSASAGGNVQLYAAGNLTLGNISGSYVYLDSNGLGTIGGIDAASKVTATSGFVDIRTQGAADQIGSAALPLVVDTSQLYVTTESSFNIQFPATPSRTLSFLDLDLDATGLGATSGIAGGPILGNGLSLSSNGSLVTASVNPTAALGTFRLTVNSGGLTVPTITNAGTMDLRANGALSVVQATGNGSSSFTAQSYNSTVGLGNVSSVGSVNVTAATGITLGSVMGTSASMTTNSGDIVAAADNTGYEINVGGGSASLYAYNGSIGGANSFDLRSGSVNLTASGAGAIGSAAKPVVLTTTSNVGLNTGGSFNVLGKDLVTDSLVSFNGLSLSMRAGGMGAGSSIVSANFPLTDFALNTFNPVSNGTTITLPDLTNLTNGLALYVTDASSSGLGHVALGQVQTDTGNFYLDAPGSVTQAAGKHIAMSGKAVSIYAEGAVSLGDVTSASTILRSYDAALSFGAASSTSLDARGGTNLTATSVGSTGNVYLSANGGNLTATSVTSSGSVRLYANGGNLSVGNVSSGSYLDLNAGNTLTAGDLTGTYSNLTGTYSISAEAGGALTVGNVTAPSDAYLYGDSVTLGRATNAALGNMGSLEIYSTQAFTDANVLDPTNGLRADSLTIQANAASGYSIDLNTTAVSATTANLDGGNGNIRANLTGATDLLLSTGGTFNVTTSAAALSSFNISGYAPGIGSSLLSSTNASPLQTFSFSGGSGSDLGVSTTATSPLSLTMYVNGLAGLNVALSNVSTYGGNVTVYAYDGGLTASNLNTLNASSLGGDIRLYAYAGNLSASSVTTSATRNVNLVTYSGNLTASAVYGGPLYLWANFGSISADNLFGAATTLEANNDITLGYVSTTNASAPGGPLTVRSYAGSILNPAGNSLNVGTASVTLDAGTGSVGNAVNPIDIQTTSALSQLHVTARDDIAIDVRTGASAANLAQLEVNFTGVSASPYLEINAANLPLNFLTRVDNLVTVAGGATPGLTQLGVSNQGGALTLAGNLGSPLQNLTLQSGSGADLAINGNIAATGVVTLQAGNDLLIAASGGPRTVSSSTFNLLAGGAIQLLAGASAGESLAITATGSSQIEAGRDILVNGAAGGASVSSGGGNMTVEGRDFWLRSGSGGASLSSGNLYLYSYNGGSHGVRIQAEQAAATVSSGYQQVYAYNGISVLGDNFAGAAASLNATGSQYLYGYNNGAINIHGGDFAGASAAISAGVNQQVYNFTGLNISAGNAANAFARMASSGQQTVSIGASGIVLTAGAAEGASAELNAVSYQYVYAGTGGITLTGGSSANAANLTHARIRNSTSSTQTVSTYGGITLLGGGENSTTAITNQGSGTQTVSGGAINLATTSAGDNSLVAIEQLNATGTQFVSAVGGLSVYNDYSSGAVRIKAAGKQDIKAASIDVQIGASNSSPTSKASIEAGGNQDVWAHSLLRVAALGLGTASIEAAGALQSVGAVTFSPTGAAPTGDIMLGDSTALGTSKILSSHGSGFQEVIAGGQLSVLAGGGGSLSKIDAAGNQAISILGGGLTMNGGSGSASIDPLTQSIFANGDVSLTNASISGDMSALVLTQGNFTAVGASVISPNLLWASAGDFSGDASSGFATTGAIYYGGTYANSGTVAPGIVVSRIPVYGAASSGAIAPDVPSDLCAINPDLCKPPSPNDSPISEDGAPKSSRLDPGKKEGCTEGSFGCEEDEKDKKKSDEANDGKKDEKPAQKKVA
ncbi:MAG: filamentous hemagglutinin N-terminal domain-containing protein, partial [Rhodocyclaceae bacterium]|nr:filamentous hemagglutinin N-terminal domain-containing protein [Rhodocyclaceae bacterium]